MKYMKFNDSAILREFGRMMEEKDGLVKVAQAATGLNPQQQEAWAQVLQGHGPGTKAWNNAESLLKSNPAYAELMAKASNVYFNESANDALAWKKVIDAGQQAMANPAPAAPVAPTKAASVEKTADQKCYDVTPKEDLVDLAHPQTAHVAGDVVENANEQHAADKAVAEKSAAILKALYKLAKRLQAEQNEEAYKLVKATFLEVSATLKKAGA